MRAGPAISGPSLSIDYRDSASNGECAGKGRGFMLRGESVYQQDEDGSWFPALTWDGEVGGWRIAAGGARNGNKVHSVSLSRWDRRLSVPRRLLVEVEDSDGQRLHSEILCGDLSFSRSPTWKPVLSHVYRGDDGRRHENLVSLYDGVWRGLKDWSALPPTAAGLTVLISVPADELVTLDLSIGERSRLSALAAR